MTDKPTPTFIVDCPTCKAKVAAQEHGRLSTDGYMDRETGELSYGVIISLGKCPMCRSILVGESQQIAIENYDSAYDEWADPIRVYPDPPKTFRSTRIPKIVSDSISEGMKSLQASANVAACVMFGRALEAICRDLLEPKVETPPTTLPAPPKRHIMLGEGLRKLKEKGLIDQRLLDWSQELHAFRNIAAHPTDITISREEADDLRSFVFAIVEYIYDLTDRYNEFKERQAKKNK